MNKVYISSSSPYKAHGLAEVLKRKIKGLVIVSTWHNLLGPGVAPEVKLRDDEDKQDRAVANLVDLDGAEILIMMDDYDSVPGGKHFELGVAFNAGKQCIVLGRREHLYTRHPEITNAANLQELLGILKELKAQ